MTSTLWTRYVAAGLLGLGGTVARAADPAVPVYAAVYEVEYKGKNLGTSEFTVTYDAADESYEFTSRTTAKGLAKLAAPNPVVERSHFHIVDGQIRPVEFWYEDGSRKGEDNVHVAFDWDKRVAVVEGEGGPREVTLEDASFDRGSMQVALMRDLMLTGQPGLYRLADDAAKSYQYVDNGEAMTDTGVGTLATRAFVQQREGSSRSTWLWVAPELSYLPARIEQRKNGEVTTAFKLVSVKGIEKK